MVGLVWHREQKGGIAVYCHRVEKRYNIFESKYVYTLDTAIP